MFNQIYIKFGEIPGLSFQCGRLELPVLVRSNNAISDPGITCQ
jgi:hypothetical protein